MKNIRVGSPLYKAINILSENNRVYYNDLLLQLNSRTSRTNVIDATKPGDYIYHKEHYTCTIVNSDGKGYKRILSVDPSASFLMNAVTGYNYEDYHSSLREQGTNETARERSALSSRCAIAASLMGATRVEEASPQVAPYYLPVKHIKTGLTDEDKRTRFSQMRGVFVNRYSAPIPMYSCAGLKGLAFHGFGEEKMLTEVRTIFPAYPYELDTCIITGDRYQAALDTLRTRKRFKFEGLSEEEDERMNAARVTEVYRHIIFAPMDTEGINILKLFANDPAGRAVTRLLVPDAELYASPLSIFEYDAKVGDRYYLQFLTGDIARMRRVAGLDEKNITIFCFPGQIEFLKSLFASCDNKPEIIPITKTSELMDDLSIEHYKRRKDC